jgi:hypothetical protein
MVAQIDLSGELSGIPDNIVVFGLNQEPDNIKFFEIPNDYHPSKYDYIPSVSGVYDPNGFVLKEVISEQQTKKQALIDAGFTPEQAELISLL